MRESERLVFLVDPILDALSFREPDLAVHDELVATPMTRDPGNPPTAAGDDHEET